MIYNIFTTKVEADIAQQRDYQRYLADKADETCAKYLQDTKRYADVIELPGGWGYTPYPNSDHVYSTIDYTLPGYGFSE